MAAGHFPTHSADATSGTSGPSLPREGRRDTRRGLVRLSSPRRPRPTSLLSRPRPSWSSQAAFSVQPPATSPFHLLPALRLRLPRRWRSNTLFATSWPLSYFLFSNLLTAGWAHTHNVATQVSHISGKINTWAAELVAKVG